MKGNALIKKTSLAFDGVLTCWIHLEQNGSGQSFGGWVLDDIPKEDGDRQPSKVCGFFIKRVLDVVGVDSWEDLPGKYIRVDGEDFGEIFGIGNIIEDKWFYPREELKVFTEESECT